MNEYQAYTSKMISKRDKTRPTTMIDDKPETRIQCKKEQNMNSTKRGKICYKVSLNTKKNG